MNRCRAEANEGMARSHGDPGSKKNKARSARARTTSIYSTRCPSKLRRRSTRLALKFRSHIEMVIVFNGGKPGESIGS